MIFHLLPHRLQLLGLLAALLLTPALFAGTERLDDSASPRSRVQAPQVLSEQGRLLSESMGAKTAILKFGRVDYKLATAKFMGRTARIYYVVPHAIAGLRSPAALRVEWRGNGVFASGSARPGERTLVWSGVIRQPWISEGLDLTMQLNLDGIALPPNAPFGFESYFEIETTP